MSDLYAKKNSNAARKCRTDFHALQVGLGPVGNSLERLTFLIGFGFALLLLWQAAGLDTWSVIGLGPGLFPMLTTAFCCIVAGLLFILPSLARSHVDAELAPEPPLEPAERRTFVIYCAALPLRAPG
jgi:hypothetical protein